MQDCHDSENKAHHSVSPLQKIGGLIRESREQKSVSIEDLAESLRIGQEQLIAIENGDESLLPEKVFIKAMVRRVAERIDLDLGSLLDELNSNKKVLPDKPKKEIRRFPQNKLLGAVPTWNLLSGLALITTSVFAFNYLSNVSNQGFQKKSNPFRKLAPKTRSVDSSYHIVAPGQTLSMISKFHEIPLKMLIRINDLNNPDKLKIGTKLSLKSKQ